MMDQSDSATETNPKLMRALADLAAARAACGAIDEMPGGKDQEALLKWAVIKEAGALEALSKIRLKSTAELTAVAAAILPIELEDHRISGFVIHHPRPHVLAFLRQAAALHTAA